jgi:aminopeptidase N
MIAAAALPRNRASVPDPGATAARQSATPGPRTVQDDMRTMQRRRRLLVLLAATLSAACSAPQVVQRPSPAAGDTVPLPGEPPPHAPGRVPPPGPYLPGFDALHYHIAVDVPATGVRIRGQTHIDIAVLAPRRDTLRLDLTGLRATAVQVGERGAAPRAGEASAAFRQADGRLFIALPLTVRAGDTIRVSVGYDGTPDDGLIIRDNVHGERGAFGDNWPDRGRFWFPSIDHPSHKATVAFEVRVPAGWQVVANGVRMAADWRPLAGDIRADAAPPQDGVWRWRMDQPIPPHLMVIGAARFAVATIDACAQGGRTPRRPDGCVPTGYWVFPQDSASGARAFRRAGEMLSWYSQLIAPYPYDRLAHVQSATRFGGMENAGAIFYSDQAITRGTLGEGTVAHEIAHQWFGNAVTPARWADLWLSEGFATYFGALYFEHADGVERFREIIDNSRAGYLRSQVTDLAIVDTLAVPGNDLLGLLNANSYNKGGAVLHMLRGLLGDSSFFGGVRRYYTAHLHGNAVTADLRRALEAASGQDLGWFFDQWLYRPGHPVFRVSHRWDAPAGEAVVGVAQVQRASWPTFRVPVQIELQTAGGAVRRAIDVTQRAQEFRFRLPAASTGVRLDPDGWVLKVVEES